MTPNSGRTSHSAGTSCTAYVLVMCYERVHGDGFYKGRNYCNMQQDEAAIRTYVCYVYIRTYVRTHPTLSNSTCTNWQLQDKVNTYSSMAVYYANPHTATVHPEYRAQQVTGTHQSTVPFARHTEQSTVPSDITTQWCMRCWLYPLRSKIKGAAKHVKIICHTEN